MESDPGFQTALSEARKGASEGGVPIGAALVSREGKVMGQGRNMRVQNGSTILHVCIKAAVLAFVPALSDTAEPSD